MSTGKPLVVIVGPTAVGKTSIAIELAERLSGEIVSADSRLFYRGMDIGTAKPSKEDQARVPHHLVDVADPDQTWSISIFQKAAYEAIANIHSREKLPFLVGGSGQYIHAITKGWIPPEVKPNPKMRSVLEKIAKENGPEWLHAKLRLVDPSSADMIEPRNVRRTTRALEVIFTTGLPFSEQRGSRGPQYHLIQIGLKLPRPELYKRIDDRIDNMFANGFLIEVKSLLERGYSPELPTMSAIGYSECIQVLNGKMSLDEAKQHMRKITRVFVRRQSNWFKENDPAITWFDAGVKPEAIIAHIKAGMV